MAGFNQDYLHLGGAPTEVQLYRYARTQPQGCLLAAAGTSPRTHSVEIPGVVSRPYRAWSRGSPVDLNQ